jgi:hypothetical protein
MSTQTYEKVTLCNINDLAFIKNCIRERIFYATSIPIDTLEHYHLTHNDHHYRMRKKSTRQFTSDAVEQILGLPSLLYLVDRFSNYTIDRTIDENGIGDRPEIYFRLCRPGYEEDIGDPHMDCWYHQVAGLGHTKGSTYKVWIAICSQPQLNGLKFFPYADVENVQWVNRNSKPACTPGQVALGDPVLPAVTAGEAFIFKDDVIHMGALNEGDNTRVSVEITFVPK